MKITKEALYNKLQDELSEALPKIANDCDVGVDEALCDKWSKDYNEFHEKAAEIVEVELGEKNGRAKENN